MKNILNSKIICCPGFVFKTIGKEGVLVRLTDNVVSMDKVLTINELGVFIYNLLTKKPLTGSEVLDAILEEFEVSEEIALKDLTEFIYEANNLGVFKIEQLTN